MSSQAKTGQIIFFAIFGLLGIASLLQAIGGLFGGSIVPVVRFFLTAFLIYALWNGQMWARWVWIVLFSITGILFVPLMFNSPNIAGSVFSVFAVIYGFGSAALLLFSKQLMAFLSEKSS